jgi:hypothetical protein
MTKTNCKFVNFDQCTTFLFWRFEGRSHCRQEFTLSYPLANATYTGSNVYAILRAPKSASTEALGKIYADM